MTLMCGAQRDARAAGLAPVARSRSSSIARWDVLTHPALLALVGKRTGQGPRSAPPRSPNDGEISTFMKELSISPMAAS